MAGMRGGMEFLEGEPVKLPPPPGSMVARTLQLECPGRPEVVAGQRVKAGQAIAEAPDQRTGSRVCPVDGSVRRIIPFDMSGGARLDAAEGRPVDEAVEGGPFDVLRDVPSEGPRADRGHQARQYLVVIEPEEQRVPTSIATPPPQRQSIDSWLTAFRRTSAWQEYGLPFSLIEQLAAVRDRPPTMLICIGLDQFPPYPVRSSLLASFPDDAVLGTQILSDLIGAQQTLMLSTRHPRVMSRLKESCRNYRLRLAAVHNIYPAADPTLVAMSYAPTKSRRLPYGENPGSVGLVMITPWTAIRIARWFTLGRLDMVRPVLIAWPRARTPMTIAWAMPGQPLASLDPALAGDAEQLTGRVVAGNPMTGRSLIAPHDGHDQERWAPSVPEDELLISILSPQPRPPAEPCISCGWCVDVCPTRLNPWRLSLEGIEHATRLDVAERLRWCIHCGLCTHVCPSGLPLAQTLADAAARSAQGLHASTSPAAPPSTSSGEQGSAK